MTIFVKKTQRNSFETGNCGTGGKRNVNKNINSKFQLGYFNYFNQTEPAMEHDTFVDEICRICLVNSKEGLMLFQITSAIQEKFVDLTQREVKTK
jgi:hypothetical protein